MTYKEFTEILDGVSQLTRYYFQLKRDKGGNEYLKHLYYVASEIHKEGKSHLDEEDFYYKAEIVGMLHDILEDTECTEQEIRNIGCDDEIIDAIKSVTREKNETYFDFIKRAKKNKIGKIVKRYDLENNMDIRRLNSLGDYEQKRLKKYWYSWRYITDQISEEEYNTVKL